VSRAFVKEDEGDSQVPVPKPQRRHPYYVTPGGFQQLQQRLAQAQAAGNARESEELESRIEEAIVVDPHGQNPQRVAFGARVTVEQPDHKRQTYRIVGEDEADPLQGSISWLSPLAQALLEHGPGERVVWRRPAGNVALNIISIAY
jgi:transcription elongation GreA/GreB family factor